MTKKNLIASIEALRPKPPVPAIAGDPWDAGYETAIEDVLRLLREEESVKAPTPDGAAM